MLEWKNRRYNCLTHLRIYDSYQKLNAKLMKLDELNKIPDSRFYFGKNGTSLEHRRC